MKVIFMKSKYILPKNMTYTAKEFLFIYLLMAEKEKNISRKIILSMYNNNIEIRKKKYLFTFHKIDLLLLWFFDTIGSHKQLVLACLAGNSAYKRFVSNISCYHNCLHSSYESPNVEKNLDILKWKIYNVTIRHFLHYLKINKWCRHQKNIATAKEIYICTAKFAFKKSKKIYEYSQAYQNSTT